MFTFKYEQDNQLVAGQLKCTIETARYLINHEIVFNGIYRIGACKIYL